MTSLCVYLLDRKCFASSLQHLVHWVDLKIKLVKQTAELRREARCVVVTEQQASCESNDCVVLLKENPEGGAQEAQDPAVSNGELRVP